MAECLGKRPAFFVMERPWIPSSSTILPQRNFVLSKILAPVRRPTAIQNSSGLSRFPTLAIGNASDQSKQAVMWLSCAASNQQWFQGLLVFGRVLSESLQVRSSQAACISFVVVMNHGVRTIRQLHRLYPHTGFPGEGSIWLMRPLHRHEMMTGNMAGTGLQQNKDPGLHI